jgi:hypothetical protein
MHLKEGHFCLRKLLVHPERADYLSFQTADDLLAENRGEFLVDNTREVGCEKASRWICCCEACWRDRFSHYHERWSASGRMRGKGPRGQGINLQKRAENIETCMRAADPTKVPELQKVAKS